MNAKGSKRLTVVALALYAAGALGWVLYQPCRPEALFRAMPENSRAISAHRHLSRHWTPDLTHPIVNAVATSLGFAEPAGLGEDQDWLRLITWLSGSITVGAWVPRKGWGDGPGTFYAASWIGGARAAGFRLLLAARWIPGLGRLQVSEHGTRYLSFVLDSPSTGRLTRQALSFDLVDGMLLAAWSSDPNAVRQLGWRLQHGKPTAPVLGARAPWKDWAESPAPHRLWWHTQSAGADSTSSVAFDLLELSPERLVVSLTVPSPIAPLAPTAPGSSPSSTLPSFIPADAPVAMAMADAQVARIVLEDAWPELFPPMAGQDGPLLGWVCGAPYEGRIMGILSPALFVATPFRSPPETSWMLEVLDRLNARWGLGLTHRSDTNAEERLVDALLIDSSRLGFGGVDRQNGHLGVITPLDNWFVAGSSAGSLRRQLANRSEHDDAPWNRWLASNATRSDIALSFWADPDGLAREIRYALALIRLGQIVMGLDLEALEQVSSNPALPLTIDLLNAISPFGELYGHARVLPMHPPEMQLTLKIH